MHIERITHSSITHLKTKTIFFACILLLGFNTEKTFAFSSGMHLSLGAVFGGSVTMPQLTREVLNDLNPLATSMTGTMSKMLAGGSVDIGYIFMSDQFAFLPRNSFFSGFSIFGSLGIGQSSTGQKITAKEQNSGTQFDIFMIVDFLPTIDAGITAKAYFWERLGVGFNVGTRIPADLNPQYLLYTSLSEKDAIAIGLEKQVGTIIVTEDMIKKMNPFMISLKGIIDYSIPLSQTIELTLGVYGKYSWFRPMYLTMPANLRDLTLSQGGDPDKPQPDYWLNAFDFGFSLAVSFRLQKPLSRELVKPQTIRRSYNRGDTL